MPANPTTLFAPFARRCRTVAAALIGAFWRGKSGADVEALITDLAMRRQVSVVVGVLAFLFLVSLFAAQFGLVGLAGFFVVVILLIR